MSMCLCVCVCACVCVCVGGWVGGCACLYVCVCALVCVCMGVCVHREKMVEKTYALSGAMTLSTMTLGIMILSITTTRHNNEKCDTQHKRYSVKGHSAFTIIMLSVSFLYDYAECHYGECRGVILSVHCNLSGQTENSISR